MRKLVLESAVLLAAVISVAVVLGRLESWTEPNPGVASALAMFSAAIAVAAGLAAEAVTRLAERPALRRVSAAMALYGLVVVPATATGSVVDMNSVEIIVLAAVRYTGTIAAIGLLLLVVATFDRPRPWPVRGLRTPASGLRGLLVALALVAAAGTAAGLLPELAYSVVRSPALIFGVSMLWLNVGMATIVSGVLRRRRLFVWIGFGELAVVTGHAGRLWAGDPTLSSPLLTPGMRAVGVSIVLVAVLRVAYRMYRQLEGDRERLAEAEAAATQARERLSVQAHELRNALAGVDGAAQLLAMDDPAGRIDRTALRAALSAELDRMRSMLASESAHPQRERVELKALLEQLVLIRQGNGTQIALTAESDLTADVPPDVVAQVITNILANCERHAPGARVWVEAYRLGDMARVQVQDDGPGIPAGQEREMLRYGARRADSAGDGIGLHVCRELVVEHGGRLRLAPTRPDRPGCVVLVDLPIEARHTEARPSPPRSHRGPESRWIGSRRDPKPTMTTSIGNGNADF